MNKKKRFIALIGVLLMVFQLIPFAIISNPQEAIAAGGPGDPEASFVDPNLHKMITSWLGKNVTDTVYKSDLTAKLTSTSGRLNFNPSSDIATYDGMEIFEGTGLKEFIGTFSSALVDISALSSITSLENIQINNSKVNNISGFRNLINLNRLYLFDSELTDISELGFLVNLTFLDISGKHISDVSPISSLTKLQTLNIVKGTSATDWIRDISGFENLADIRTLQIGGNKITDISPLNAINTVENLMLQNNYISDLTPIANLSNLKMLGIQNNYINIFSGPQKTIFDNIVATSGKLSTPQYRLAAYDGDSIFGNPIGSISLNVGQTFKSYFLREQTSNGVAFSKSGQLPYDDIVIQSSDSSIVQVDNNGVLTAIAPGTATIKAMLAGIDSEYTTDTFDVTVTGPTLDNIVINPSTATINVGDNQQYTATAFFSDNSTQDITNLATWSLTDGSIATIDANGFASGTTAGSTGVIASWNGLTGSANLTVNAPVTLQNITVNPANATIFEGETQQYVAIATMSDNSTQDVSNLATWSTGSALTATIDNTGLASGLSAGSTTVSATWGGLTGNVNLTVQPVLQSIRVTPANAAINVGQTQQYQATAVYSNGAEQDVTAMAAWTTGAVATATVDNAGLASGVAAGATTVSATWGGLSGNANLTVNAPATVTSIQVTPNNSTIQAGQTRQYTAIATFSDNTTQDVTALSTWTTSDPSIATIDAAGLANGIKAGSITVSAVWSGLTGTAGLNVTAPPPVIIPPIIIGPVIVGIEVTPIQAVVEVGDSKQFIAVAKYSDNSSLTITNFAEWSVSDKSIASIGEKGLAKGLKAGEVKVSASWNGMTGDAELIVKDKPKGSITVHYVDSDGNKIAPDDVLKDVALGVHRVSAISIPKYRVIDPDNNTVNITRDRLHHEVTFQYEAILGSITAQYKDTSSGKLLAENHYFKLQLGKHSIDAGSFDGFKLIGERTKVVTLTADQSEAIVVFNYEPIPAPPIVQPEKPKQNTTQEAKKPDPVPVVIPDPEPEPEPIPEPEIQYGKVYGVVRDIDGNPLPNIQVEIHSEPQVTITNDKGEYFFDRVELGEHTVILKDAASLLELGRINVQVDDQTLEDVTQMSIFLTEDSREKRVDFLLVLPEPIPEEPAQDSPVWPYPVAAGLFIAILLFLRRKNVIVYEGDKIVRKLRVKARPETLVELSKAFPNGTSAMITLRFKKAISRRLSDRDIVATFKRDEVYRHSVNADPQRKEIVLNFYLPQADEAIAGMNEAAAGDQE